MSNFPVTRTPAHSLIGIPARVNVANTRELLDAGQREMADGCRELVLDLRATDIIDSTALGAVAQLYRAAAAKNVALTLLGPKDGVRRVLAITRLDQVLKIRASLDDATASTP